MNTTPEGWITRIKGGSHAYVNVLPEEGKEPTITYFDKKQIYLPDEQEKYEKEALNRNPNTVWLGVTGWTKPPKHYHEAYGTSNEDRIYETLVTALLLESITELKRHEISVDLRHGASDAGVDAAAMAVSELIPISVSGVNCPLFMPWVKDDARGGPVFVAGSKDKYHDAYSKYHQILIVTGGRDAAFYHDYLRRLKGDGYSIVADVIQTASEKPVPGVERMPDGKVQMNNAAAFIREKNSFTYTRLPRTFEELSAITQLSVVYDAHKSLGIEIDQDVLAKLEVTAIDAHNTKQHIITKAELEERIKAAQSEFIGLNK